MPFGGADATRRDGLAKWLTTLWEALGLLNKGSAQTPAAPSSEEAERTTSISSNALNVTRVTGLAGLVAGVGAAALALFTVDKSSDPVGVVMAAYIAVGVIVAAALIAAAIVVLADIRSRAAVSVASIGAVPTHPRVKHYKAEAGTSIAVQTGDDVILVDASEADVDIKLPNASDFRDRVLTIERLDASANLVTISDGVAFRRHTVGAGSPELKVFVVNGAWTALGDPVAHG